MKRSEIEAKLEVVTRMQSEARDPAQILAYNRLIEKLVMMEADDD